MSPPIPPADPVPPGYGSTPPSSLRQLLTRWVIGPLLALIAISIVLAYFVALQAANDAYDTELLDPALALARHVVRQDGQVMLDLPPVALEALRVDTADRLYFEIVSPEGGSIVGSSRIPRPASPLNAKEHDFYDANIDNRLVRVAAYAAPFERATLLVLVAETYLKRDLLVKEILLASVLPALAIALAGIGLSMVGVARVLAPLDRVRSEILARSPRDLAPMAERDNPQEIRPLLGALNDLFRRLQAALDNQQRFIENAAHQLRTPIAGLKTHAELARRQDSPPALRDLLDMIASETDRTGHLINQLLTLARADTGGHAELARQPVNLRDVAGRAAGEWVPRSVTRDIDLGFELEDAWTLGEPLLLREMLANLIDNALAYTPSGGVVTVRTRSDAKQAVLEVEDNGPGIPEAERSQVFERFYRIAGTEGPGTGLGLPIVAEIAQRHDAQLELTAPPSGQGTLFRVRLPRLATDQPQAA